MEKTLNVADHKCPAIILKCARCSHCISCMDYRILKDIWRQIGVTDLLIEKHIPFLALDMPYGMRSRCQPKTRNPEVNLNVASEAAKNVFGSS